ncbi:MAG: hypothetical protein JWN67_1140 [Actinomycetia bacterium]|nr:hypothetical protein [Actinomycetes bacterium]
MDGDAPTPAPAGQYLARRRNHLGSIKKDLGDLQGWRSLIAELIQNADDASDATEMSFTIDDDAVTVWNDGTFSRCDELDAQTCPRQRKGEPACDFHSFSDVAGGAKEDRDDATGAFGIGFTAVYQVTDLPVLRSAGKRWTIDETKPEESRIYSEDVADEGGTMFLLPWARELSVMRQELEQPIITSDSIRELTDELFAFVPEAMLFLRRLTRIGVRSQGRSVTFSRKRAGTTIEVRSTEARDWQWYVLEGSLGLAEELRRAHPNELRRRRSPSVAVAINLTDESFDGRFYATLPTDEPTLLPFSVQGSFFPKPDRKRIRLDNAPRDEWNRAIIAEAAALLARSLEPIRDAAGDEALVSILAAAFDLRRRAQSGEVDRSFATWWTELSRTLPTAEVVPTVSGGHCSPQTALLWGGHDVEADAGPLLAGLGLDLVSSNVRAAWFSFQEANGLRQMGLEHVAAALMRADARAPEGWARGVASTELARLWRLLDHLVATRGRSTAESREALPRLRIFPLVDGTFTEADRARTAVSGTVNLLADAAIAAPLLDGGLRECPGLLALVREVSPADMVAWVDGALQGEVIPAGFDLGRFLDWFTNREDAVLASVPDRLRDLPVFPTGRGFRPLGALALPVEGFRDPLDLAEVLHLEGRPASTRAFLLGLGAPELTLAHYCTEFVPRTVESGIDDRQRRALLDLLAAELSRIQDDEEVHEALADLPLVSCTDGVFRRGTDVYSAGVDPLLVGPDRSMAATPASPGVRRLYEWLGVSPTPRPTDVVNHCHSLRSAPSNLRDAATAVLRHLKAQREEALERDFAALQQLPWLPVQGDRPRAATPEAVHTIFRQNLFRSQADFLDIGQRDQASCTAVLQWLGVPTDPTVEQVVAHLLHCRDSGTPVKTDMWNFLQGHFDDPALERLVSEPCILLDDGSYVLGSHCFWSENPFGRLRHHLGERFRQWSELFERVGVRDRPAVTDAVDVLQAIAVAHGGADEPLLSADVEIVESCWVLLDRLVRDGSIEDSDLIELASTECVLAADRSLRRPSDVLFRDSSAITSEFDEEARRFLIARPENEARALEAAGVRHLRDALTTSVVERADAEGSSLLERRFHERRLLVLRVLAAVDADASTKVSQFAQGVEIVPLLQLAVVEQIELAGRRFESRSLARTALFRAEAHEMLVADGDAGDRRWDEIATELAFALGVDAADVPSTAIALKLVLEDNSSESVVRALDAMRFPPLDEAIEVEIADEVMDPFAEDDDDDVDPGAPEEEFSDETLTDFADEETGDPEGSSPKEASAASSQGDGQTGGSPDAETGQDGDEGEAPDGDDETPGHAEGRGTAAPPEHDAHRRAGARQQGKTRGSQRQHQREQLRSYLQPEGELGSTRERDGLNEEQRRKVDDAAVNAVVAYEERVGRTPERMPHENEGFDIRSVAVDGAVRYIEVKGTSPQWDRQGVALSSRQFQEARTRSDEFWLYVVEVGKPGSDPIRIQDPANRVRQYFVDSGWRIADEERERVVRQLPQLLIHADPPAGGALQLIDWCDGVTQLGWIDVDLDRTPPDAWALQIAGDALGLALRGGVVVMSPGEPEDHDWVVVRLADQLDPDTGAQVCIRQWVPERDFSGTLLGVRLQSDGSTPPITIEDLSTVRILGIVSHQFRVDDLSTLGLADG